MSGTDRLAEFKPLPCSRLRVNSADRPCPLCGRFCVTLGEPLRDAIAGQRTVLLVADIGGEDEHLRADVCENPQVYHRDIIENRLHGRRSSKVRRAIFLRAALKSFVAPLDAEKFDPGQIRPAANGRHAAAPGAGEASSSPATYPPWRACATADGGTPRRRRNQCLAAVRRHVRIAASH